MATPYVFIVLSTLYGLHYLMSCLDPTKVVDAAASSAEASSDEHVPLSDDESESDPEWSDDSDDEGELDAPESLPSDLSESSRLTDFASACPTLTSTSCLGQMAALLGSCSEAPIPGMSFNLVRPIHGPPHYGDSTPISIRTSSAGRPLSEFLLFPSQALQALKVHLQTRSFPASSTAPSFQPPVTSR